MAPKRPSRLHDPPPASPSEEEDEESDLIGDKERDGEQSNTHKKTESDDDDEEEEEEEESEEEEEEEEDEKTPPLTPTVDNKPSSQKPISTTAPKPQSSSDSEGDEGSDSDSDSDRTQPSPTASDFTIRPIVSKPIEDSSKSKKPIPKPPAPASPTPSRARAKRPAEAEQNGKGNSRKKKSKVGNGDEENGAVEEKKSGIHRLWSEDDEIVILKGLVDYQSKRGADPFADMGAFHEFIKGLLHVDVSKNQLTDKIRRLKKKYKNNAEKGDNGEDPVFSRPHENKSFELSKKIWGGGTSNGVDEKINTSKGRKSSNVGNSMASPKKDVQEVASQEVSKGEVNVYQGDCCSMYPLVNHQSLRLGKYSYMSLPEPARSFVKERMSLIGNRNANELEEKWKNLQMEEIELYLKRLDLIQEQAKLVLNAMKSSKS